MKMMLYSMSLSVNIYLKYFHQISGFKQEIKKLMSRNVQLVKRQLQKAKDIQII